ncbi:hypothetical protein NQ318_013802, partial [Aromia moschata]
YPHESSGITTTHHDKPEESRISRMATKMKETVINVTLTPTERQKRLLPYENFYLTQGQFQRPGQFQRYQFDNQPPKESYQQNPSAQDVLYQNKFTPFLESNAIPGPFRPMIPTRQPVEYNKVPDYSEIYDKLSQLKLQNRRPAYFDNYRPQPVRYVQKPKVNFIQNYKAQPVKTTIETFVATNIDVPDSQEEYNPQVTPANNYDKVAFLKTFGGNEKPYANQQIAMEIPSASYPQQNYQAVFVGKPYQAQKGKPYIVVQARPEGQRVNLQPVRAQKPIIVLQRKPSYSSKPVGQDQYAPVTFLPLDADYRDQYGQAQPQNLRVEPQRVQVQPQVVQVQPEYVTPTYEEYQTATPKYDEYQTIAPKYEYQTVAPTADPPRTENANALGQILKQLQANNALPQTLTADNIDNSIKTLVRILEALKTRQKTLRPIVVEDDVSSEYHDTENEADVGAGAHEVGLPGTVTQSFPGDAPEGRDARKTGSGLSGAVEHSADELQLQDAEIQGVLWGPRHELPAINPGVARLDTTSDYVIGFLRSAPWPSYLPWVWHYCDLNGGQASFLCPNGTIFSQVALTCDWWYNVKCASTPQLYVLNERLYKYIIPLSPKFPEDYSGPLVDKYLALKFQEMEEKMKKEKAGRKKASKEKEKEELQEIDEEHADQEHEIPKKPTVEAQERETLETIEDDNDNDK